MKNKTSMISCQSLGIQSFDLNIIKGEGEGSHKGDLYPISNQGELGGHEYDVVQE